MWLKGALGVMAVSLWLLASWCENGTLRYQSDTAERIKELKRNLGKGFGTIYSNGDCSISFQPNGDVVVTDDRFFRTSIQYFDKLGDWRIDSVGNPAWIRSVAADPTENYAEDYNSALYELLESFEPYQE